MKPKDNLDVDGEPVDLNHFILLISIGITELIFFLGMLLAWVFDF